MKERDYFFIFIMATYIAMNLLLLTAFTWMRIHGSIPVVENNIGIWLLEAVWLFISLVLGLRMTWKRIIKIGKEK